MLHLLVLLSSMYVLKNISYIYKREGGREGGILVESMHLCLIKLGQSCCYKWKRQLTSIRGVYQHFQLLTYGMYCLTISDVRYWLLSCDWLHVRAHVCTVIWFISTINCWIVIVLHTWCTCTSASLTIGTTLIRGS